MNKKGSDFLLTTIGILVLVLVVTVVLIYIFNERVQKGSQGLSACQTTGGQCVLEGECGKDEKGGSVAPFECPDLYGQKQECCFGMKKEVLI